MLNDAACFKAVYIVCGYTDLRSGMDRLAALVEAQTENRPYVPDTLYLFCGRRPDRIKGLVWEGDGWLLLYKRLSESRFQWPRSFLDDLLPWSPSLPENCRKPGKNEVK